MRERILVGAFVSLVAAAFLASVHTGIPALRQDWAWPPDQSGFRQNLFVSLGGWDSTGLGGPRGYPSYIVSLGLVFVQAVLGERLTFVLSMLALAALCAVAGAALVRRFCDSSVAAAAAMLSAVFNPWCFSKLVAGHILLILAYGGMLMLLSEALARKPRPGIIITALVLIIGELQFFVFAALIVAFLAWKRGQWLALVTAVVIVFPSVVGILGNRAQLTGTPYTVAWEVSQSVAPLQAALLNGYFTDYGRHFQGPFALGSVTEAILAGAGAIMALRAGRIAARMAVGLTALFLFLAMGFHGPIPGAFAWLVIHVPESGLFRELYDLLGFVAIGYLVLCAIAVSGLRPLRYVWLGAAAVTSLAWFIWPPSSFWVESWALPKAVVTTQKNTRFALMPAYQPMSFDGRGAGTDPDAVARPGNVTPINEYLAAYPASTALSAFALRGDVGELEALSVSEVIERRRFRSKADALAQQWAFRIPESLLAARSNTVIRIHALPELSLLPRPALGTLVNNVGGGNVLWADAPAPTVGNGKRRVGRADRVLPVVAPNRYVHPDRGWVDARFAFAERPELGQAFGGAVTTSRSAVLPIRPGLAALVWVRGALLAEDGRPIVENTDGYRWIKVPPSARALRCRGMCLVAAEGTPPAGLPLNPPRHASAALSFTAVTPWLVKSTLPRGPAGLLRYNVAFDRHWQAFAAGRALQHVRVDAVVNGWMLPVRHERKPLIIVEVLAAEQVACEALSLVFLGALVAWGVADRTRPRRHDVR